MKTAKQRSNSKGPKKIRLTWDDYAALVEDLCNNIKSSGLKLCGVYGIPRGGVLPAVMLSHSLGINYYPTVPLEPSYNGSLLIVDDISDTGKTFKQLIRDCLSNSFWKNRTTGVPGKYGYITATLFKHKKSKYTPDICVRENDRWIVFPYERD